jgi:hypothetical protein
MQKTIRMVVAGFAVVLGVNVGGLGSALPAGAEETDDCPTWFPDFSCQREFRYEGFVAPVTMPYLFEDPFITSGANLVGIWHDFPNNGNLNGGLKLGEAGIMALQLRLAITERLAFIATKDGLVIYDADSPVLKDDEDLADISFGFKYALIKMEEDNFIFTPALRYQAPVGANRVFQGWGDGVFIPSATLAWGIDNFHVIGGVGGQAAIDHDKNSDSFFYNLHLDYAVLPKLVPFVEMNGMVWTRSGDGTANLRTKIGKVPVKAAQTLFGTGAFEGADYANIGSSGITGKTLFTMAWGVRVPLTRNLSIGAAYERALQGKKNSFKQRVTVSTSFEF